MSMNVVKIVVIIQQFPFPICQNLTVEIHQKRQGHIFFKNKNHHITVKQITLHSIPQKREFVKKNIYKNHKNNSEIPAKNQGRIVWNTQKIQAVCGRQPVFRFFAVLRFLQPWKQLLWPRLQRPDVRPGKSSYRKYRTLRSRFCR